MSEKEEEEVLARKIYTVNPVYVGGVDSKFGTEKTATMALGNIVFETFDDIYGKAPNPLYPTRGYIMLQTRLLTISEGIKGIIDSPAGLEGTKTLWNLGGQDAFYKAAIPGLNILNGITAESRVLPARGLERGYQSFDANAVPLPFSDTVNLATIKANAVGGQSGAFDALQVNGAPAYDSSAPTLPTADVDKLFSENGECLITAAASGDNDPYAQSK